jgi:hypothetical protein
LPRISVAFEHPKGEVHPLDLERRLPIHFMRNHLTKVLIGGKRQPHDGTQHVSGRQADDYRQPTAPQLT